MSGPLRPATPLSNSPPTQVGPARLAHDDADPEQARDRWAREALLPMTAPLLAVEDLRVVFSGTDRRRTYAVDGVSFSVERGRTLGIVGESGCGKSVTSLAVMGLLPKGSAEVAGRVRFEGTDLLAQPERVMRDLRGNRLAMIF